MSKLLWSDKKRTIFGLPFSFTKYFITDKKIITQTGFFSIHEDEIDIFKITDKSMTIKLWQRICGIGSIKIISVDKDTPVKILQNIKNPRKISELISNLVESEQIQNAIKGRIMTGALIPNGAGGPPIPDSAGGVYNAAPTASVSNNDNNDDEDWDIMNPPDDEFEDYDYDDDDNNNNNDDNYNDENKE